MLEEREESVPSLMVTQGNFLPQLQQWRWKCWARELKMLVKLIGKLSFLWPVLCEDTNHHNLLCCQPLSVIEVDRGASYGIILYPVWSNNSISAQSSDDEIYKQIQINFRQKEKPDVD